MITPFRSDLDSHELERLSAELGARISIAKPEHPEQSGTAGTKRVEQSKQSEQSIDGTVLSPIGIDCPEEFG